MFKLSIALVIFAGIMMAYKGWVAPQDYSNLQLKTMEESEDGNEPLDVEGQHDSFVT